jgi:hypothetical protein
MVLFVLLRLRCNFVSSRRLVICLLSVLCGKMRFVIYFWKMSLFFKIKDAQSLDHIGYSNFISALVAPRKRLRCALYISFQYCFFIVNIFCIYKMYLKKNAIQHFHVYQENF